jgi:hypothetical protein
VALVGSVALLLVLLRYVSIRLIPSDQDNIKEVPMKKTLTARTRVFFSSVVENIWAIGVGSVVSHLSTQVRSTHDTSLHPTSGRDAAFLG